MGSPRLRGVLLCEDQEHERFFRRLLERKWFGVGKLYVKKIPKGQGAAEAYVVKNYAREVQYARSRRNENYALVVVVDGDLVKLHDRMNQLSPRREKGDKIAIFVPTRNLETWELWLCGHRDVDEDDDYKARFHRAEQRGEASAKQAVEAWFRGLSPEEQRDEASRLPALAAGREETKRLDRRRR